MVRGKTLSFRRAADTVPQIRELVGSELNRRGVEAEVVDRVVLACAEACNNAILHSTGDTYRVSVDISADACTITVSDDGEGFVVPDHIVMPPPDVVGHRGLALMDALVDNLTVNTSANGTTVVIRNSLRPNGYSTVIRL